MNANPSSSPTPANEEIIRQLKADIVSGKNWYPALLEAVKKWPASEETVSGTTYRYLIAGEAFDLLQLSERLLEAVGELVPEEEKLAFLFRNKPPVPLTAEQIRELLGEIKYAQYLNFFYGVTAEEALIQAVEEEVRKEEHGLNIHSEQELTDETYRRIYEATQKELLHSFRLEKGYPATRSISLEQMKEFYYWLFKYRLLHCDKARTASDTKKALAWLKKHAK